MKFSIITPSFNQGRFIRDCIESVRTQEDVEWEHIVTDAGSTDETLTVLKEYPHLRWTSEPDQGMSDGINKGFRMAGGDWLMWLNTDDYLLPGALRKVAAFAAAQPDAEVIYGDAEFVDAERRRLRPKREHRFDFKVLLFYGCYIPSTATFLHRRIIESGHWLDVEYRICMDFEYYVRLARLGFRFAHLPQPLAAFRWHESNTSTVLAARRYHERLRVQRDQLQRMGRTFLQPTWVLRVMFRLYQLKHIFLRWRCHGVLQ